MALFKCKMCGGSLEVANNATVVECDYCGTQQTLPKLDDEKRANLYDRANHFRRNNEFDKAMAIYEQILNEDNTDAEAYWSIVLCRYGIEYVEDPSSKRRIPTVNRAQFTSILADEDYKSALANADTYQKSIYELEAKAIDEIQKGILVISNKEEPFDVFICYKETDNSGKRTQDSVLAQDLYYGLKNEGFKVFFSRITLEEKLGSAYEPYIFAALNSAKVMVVLGTKAEHFNAVWVKNEWSRFLALIKQGQKKVLIPAYKNMDPYDLPEEFSHLQAQDMSKLGFMQDLVRGIKKIAGKEKKETVKETVIVNQVNQDHDTAPLLKRAFLFLEDGDFGSADEYAEKVLDIDPECAEAYVVKLLIGLKLRSPSQIGSYASPVDRNPNYIKALRFAKGDYRNTIEGYNQAIVDRIDLDNKNRQYANACSLMNCRRYGDAISAFSKIGSFKDSAVKIDICKQNIETDRKERIYADALRNVASSAANDKNILNSIASLQSIKGYRDADAWVEKLEARLEKWYADQKAAEEKARIKAEQEKLEAIRQAELRKIKAEQNKKKAVKAAKIGIPSLIALVLVVVLMTTLLIPMIRFYKADKLFAEGKYAEADSIYKELDGFGKSDQRISAVKAIDQVEDKKFEEGVKTLLAAGVPVELTYQTAGGNLTDTQTISLGYTLSLDDSIVPLSAEKSTTSEQTVFTFTQSSDFTGLKTPGRNGYRFVEWELDTYAYDVESKDATFTLSLKAKWSTKDYTVAYDLAGGSIQGNNVAEYDPEDQAFTLINPDRTGYTFAGWTGTGLSEPTIEVTVPTGSYGNRTYTATWKANEYTVTLLPNGGEVSNAQLVVIYDKPFTLPTPTWLGHDFSGWYIDGKKVTDGTWNEIQNITLTAKWDATDYTITYHLDNGTNAASNPKTYTIYDAIVLKEPTKTGYTFLGWTYDGQSTPTKTVSIAIGMTGNKVYTANWQANEYKVTFDANNGTVSIPELDAIYDSNVTLPTPSRTGYSFDGWYNGNQKYTSGAWKEASNVTLTAKWTANTYTVSYDANQGTVSTSSKNYVYDASYTLLTPERTGYEFLGWYNGNTPVAQSGSWLFTENLSLVAKWKAITYTVTYDAGIGTSSAASAQATYDSNFTLATASRIGYTFDGWYYNGIKYADGTWKTAKDITLTAKWIANTDTKYVVNHYQQNITDDEYTLESSQNLEGTSDATITPEVKTFTGFTSPTAQTVTVKPDGTLVVNYYYTRNYYTVTVVGNGGTSSVINLKYQSVIDTTNWTTREGCTLGGLYTDLALSNLYTDTTMPAENKTVYAYWIGDNAVSDFIYTTSANGITITGYVGNSTIIKIPAQIGGVDIVAISEAAFVDQSSVTSIIVPDTVTSIGLGAFKGCNALTDITLPFVGANEDAKGYEAVFGYIFGYTSTNGNSNYYVYSGATNVSIGSSANYYEADEFSTDFVNYKLGSSSGIYKPEGTVWQYSCYNYVRYSTNYLQCYYYHIPSMIKNVTITKQTVIPDAAFNGCEFIERITIPMATTSLGKSVFQNCLGLKRLNSTTDGLFNIPTELDTIDANTFYKCLLMDELTCGDIVSIGDYAFNGCTSLSKINSNNTNTLNLPDDLRTIGKYAFQDVALVTTVVVPDGVTNIGIGAFKGCNAITDIVLPFVGASEDAKGSEAVFGYIFGYTSTNGYSNQYVYNGATDASIGSYSNYYAADESSTDFVDYKLGSYSEIYKPKGAVWQYSCYDYVRYSTNYLQCYYYYIPSTIKNVTITKQTTIPDAAFNGCGFIESITIPTTTTSIGEAAFQNCLGLKRLNSTTDGVLNIPTGVETISENNFYKCLLLSDVTCGNITNVGAYAFAECVALETIDLGANVTTIGDYAFSGCTMLSKVNSNVANTINLPASLQSIGKYAFQNVALVTTVTVSDSVTSIGLGAFKGCNALTDITLPFVGGSEDAKGSEAVFGYIFGCVSTNAYNNNHVYNGATDASIGSYSNYYMADESSTNFVNYKLGSYSGIYKPEGAVWQYSCYDYVRSSTNYLQCYYYYIPSMIKNITITKQTSIPVAAFNGCEFIESITIPTTTTSIGGYAFQNCLGLKRLNSTADGVFNVPTAVDTIGAYTFYKCLLMSKFTCGDIERIRDYAFSGCTSLSKFNSNNTSTLNLPDDLQTIGKYAFQDVALVTTVIVPSGVSGIGMGAFKGCNAITDITLPFVGANENAKPYDAVFGYIFGYTSTNGYNNNYVYNGATDASIGSYSNYYKADESSTDFINYKLGSYSGIYKPEGAIWQYSCYDYVRSSTNYLQCYYYYIPITIKAVTITRQTAIPVAAFNGCDFIETINLPTKATAGEYAFQNCNATVNKTIVPTVASAWNGTDIATAFQSGSGTEADPYVIFSGAQLAYLAQQVNAGTTYEGVYFVLSEDIDLGGQAMTVIGLDSDHVFKGHIDGKGYVIRNFTITSDGLVVGLFGYFYGTLKNLGIETANIAATRTGNGPIYVGGLVAHSSGTIQNCYSKVTVTAECGYAVYAGGLVGYNKGSVTNSYANGDVIANSTNFGAYAGGLIGDNEGTVSGSVAYGNVTAKGYNDGYSVVGGLVGANSGTVTDCYRNSAQVVTKYTATDTASNDLGKSVTMEEIRTYCSFNWDDIIWKFSTLLPKFV